MALTVNSSTSVSVINTGIGVFPIASLNNWNNTAFSQLCLSKSDEELSTLIKSHELSPDKLDIAMTKFAERDGNRV